MTAWTAEQIAAVCHDANRRIQVLHGDPMPSLPWECETEEIRQSAIAGVIAVLGGATLEELHAEWCRGKAAQGYRRGEFKDEVARTHPALVPYLDLPPEQLVKDAVFAAIVRAMTGMAPCVPETDGERAECAPEARSVAVSTGGRWDGPSAGQEGA